MPSSSERKLVHDEKTTSGNLLTENYNGRLAWPILSSISVFIESLGRSQTDRTLSFAADDNIFTSSGGPLNLSVAPPFWLPEPVSAGDWSNGFPLGSRQPNHSPPSPPNLTRPLSQDQVSGPAQKPSPRVMTGVSSTGRGGFFGNKWFLYPGISMILATKY